ncbi:MAG: CHASE domain-containing protein [Gemmatimonadaceae bacterium]
MPRRHLPLVVLAASLTVSVAAGWIVADSGRERDEARFHNATETTVDRLQARLAAYVTMLRGARGLFAASGDVSSEEFSTYVHEFDLTRTFRGVQGIGFAGRLEASQVDSLERARRADGLADYHVYPDSARDEYFPIFYLVPLDRRNRVALGYDMYTHPIRRAAMQMARDSGTPVATGPLELVQEIDREKQVGFLIYLPLYTGVVTPVTVAERRARLRGFVYAPFRASDLFTGIFGGTTPPVAFRVYDGPAPTPARLVYDSRNDALEPTPATDRPVFEMTETQNVFGRDWTIAFTSLPAVEERSARLLGPAIALAGLLVSLLLAELTRREVLAGARAERSEQARGRFFAAMSHELRTPLNAIFGYNDLLLAGVHGELTPAQFHGIERSQRAARHLLELVNDVLDLSKVEAGKMELVEEEVWLPGLVEDLFVTLGTMAQNHGSSLHLSVAEGTQRPIVSDPRRLRQILLNLLSNAIKFGDGKPIDVVCASAPDGGVSVEVRDSGVGIAPADQQRIFEEFVQLPNAAHGGTGLGLPISRRLAVLLGGTLEVESTPGAGSVFRLTLPPRTPETH